MSIKNLSQRKPRFRRVSTIKFRLQDRDIEIIRQVHTYRFLTSSHIKALVSGSDKVILKRLQFLYHNQYLDRPRQQVVFSAGGSAPMIYGLGNKGADLLAQEFKISRSKVDWTSKNREAKTFFLNHTLLIADFMVCLELACRENNDIKLIQPEEILDQAPEEMRKRINPYRLTIDTVATIGGKTKKINIGLVPDKLFGLFFVNKPEGRNKAYFFLEADRATMPIKRKNLFRTSFYKKAVGYYFASPMQGGLFEKTFGFKHARVLTITKSADRVKNMIEINKEIDQKGTGLGLFLFANISSFSLDNPGTILKKIWLNGRGEPASVVD